MYRLGKYPVGLEPCVAPLGTAFVGLGRCSSAWPCCGRQNTEMKPGAGEGLRMVCAVGAAPSLGRWLCDRAGPGEHMRLLGHHWLPDIPSCLCKLAGQSGRVVKIGSRFYNSENGWFPLTPVSAHGRSPM